MSGLRWRPRRRQAVGPPSEHEVTVVVRAGCHLCETATTELRGLAAEWGFRLHVRDLDGPTDGTESPTDGPGGMDAATRARWADLVPVVLVDGVEHGFWRVERDRLAAAVGAR